MNRRLDFSGRVAVVTGAASGMGHGEPVEIANAILWLCSDEASYISGSRAVQRRASPVS